MELKLHKLEHRYARPALLIVLNGIETKDY